jgi:glycine/D-amino acid oxidase-like deaminating enzyme
MRHWQWLAGATDPTLFVKCGALWIASKEDPHAQATLKTFSALGVSFQKCDAPELRRQWPQFHFADHEWAVYEPEAGALLARRAVLTLVRLLIESGVRYEERLVNPHQPLDAAHTVFACGPWLGKIFPGILGRRILPSRQEVLFFGPPAGNRGFGPAHTPCWIDIGSAWYGLPDLENRGFKIALDKRGLPIDPDTADRTVSPDCVEQARKYLTSRVPSLAAAPVVESRICQYENTASSDYILDRHPNRENIWIAGGGSGHGFKHGPAIGRLVKEMIVDGRAPEEPFLLLSKKEFDEFGSQSSL